MIFCSMYKASHYLLCWGSWTFDRYKFTLGGGGGGGGGGDDYPWNTTVIVNINPSAPSPLNNITMLNLMLT